MQIYSFTFNFKILKCLILSVFKLCLLFVDALQIFLNPCLCERQLFQLSKSHSENLFAPPILRCQELMELFFIHFIVLNFPNLCLFRVNNFGSEGVGKHFKVAVYRFHRNGKERPLTDVIL